MMTLRSCLFIIIQNYKILKGLTGISDIFILLLIFFFQKLAQHILNIHCTRISLLKYSKKIPVRQLFRYSSWVITILAVISVGKGIHSIQETGWFPVTGFSLSLRINWLGIYPTLESLISQLFLLGFLLLLYYFSNHKNKIIIPTK